MAKKVGKRIISRGRYFRAYGNYFLVGVDNTMEKERKGIITLNEILAKIEKMADDDDDFLNRILRAQRSVSIVSSYLKDMFSSDLNMDDTW